MLFKLRTKMRVYMYMHRIINISLAIQCQFQSCLLFATRVFTRTIARHFPNFTSLRDRSVFVSLSFTIPLRPFRSTTLLFSLFSYLLIWWQTKSHMLQFVKSGRETTQSRIRYTVHVIVLGVRGDSVPPFSKLDNPECALSAANDLTNRKFERKGLSGYE